MTISDVPTRHEYLATGGQTDFSFGFKYWLNDDLFVLVNDVQKSLVTHYTITPNVGIDGGKVTFLSGLNLNDRVLIFRDIAPQRTFNYQQLGKFNASAVNSDFDKIWAELQEQSSKLDRTFRFNDTVFGLGDVTIPQPIGNAFLAASSDGTAVVWTTITATGSVVDATTALKGIVELATNAEAIAKAATDRAITASNLAALTPTETATGLIEIASDAEMTAATADDRAVTPKKLKTYLDASGGGSDKLFTYLYFGG